MKMAATPNTMESNMAFKPEVERIFNDLDQYRDFCRFGGEGPLDGYVFNEADLYKSNSPWGLLQAKNGYRQNQYRNRNYKKR